MDSNLERLDYCRTVTLTVWTKYGLIINANVISDNFTGIEILLIGTVKVEFLNLEFEVFMKIDFLNFW